MTALFHVKNQHLYLPNGGIDFLKHLLFRKTLQNGCTVGTNCRTGAAPLAHQRIYQYVFMIKIQRASAVWTRIDASFTQTAKTVVDCGHHLA